VDLLLYRLIHFNLIFYYGLSHFKLLRYQVLEWDGVPLVDLNFEEVCAVMDRTGEVADLLVEHGSDL
jgi:hypothetical protein